MSRCEKCGTTEINQAAQALMLLLDNFTVNVETRRRIELTTRKCRAIINGQPKHGGRR